MLKYTISVSETARLMSGATPLARWRKRVSAEDLESVSTRRSRALQPLHLRQDLLHDLRRPSADRHQAQVRPRARDVVLGRVAEAAVHLLAVVEHALREVAREELRHRDRARRGRGVLV